MKVFGIAGYSGSGKTTLIERVLPQLAARGVRTAVIKHTHHDFDIERPGKDSLRAGEAGAAAGLAAPAHRTAVLTEHRNTPPVLDGLLVALPPCDLVLVEGYKREPIPKLEVHRAETGKPWLFPEDPHILAVASDVAPPDGFPCIDINAIPSLTDFILNNALSRPIA